MRRAIRISFAVVAIISVAVILTTPAINHEVDGILRLDHSPASPPIVTFALHDPIVTLSSAASDLFMVDLRGDFLDRLC